MNNYSIQKIKQGKMISTDEYVALARDILISKGKIRNEYQFNTIIDNNTDWGIARHCGWSVRGADYIVRYYTSYNTLTDLVRSEL